MQDEIQKAVDGVLNEAQVAELESKLTDAGKKELRELMAIKAQRKTEQKKLDDTKAANQAEEDRKKKEKEDAEKASTEARKAKVSQAKAAFFTEYQIPEAEQSKYTDAEFAKFDSGSGDTEAIKQDFLKIYGALNASTLIEADKKAKADKIEREKQAAIDAAAGAGSHPNNPTPHNQPKFSEAVQKIAKDSNISLEAADKIAKEGRSRIIGG